MIRFNSDYLEGAHPRILKRLSETNFEQTPGYGEDKYCESARNVIKDLCKAPNAYVQFIVGGTQTNMILLAAALRPHQGAVAAETGHIAVHESGAIEGTGHKVLTLPHKDGKISAGAVSELCRVHFADESFEHMVQPKVVYLSQPTEYGTLYTREELIAMRGVCDRWNLLLYVDGARLGYALEAPGNDVDLPFLAEVCDAFYIGGTKQGALFGEALVMMNDALKADFRYILKQKGAMLAKGRLLGLQFEELLKDGLYNETSRHAIRLAMKLKQALTDLGYPFYIDSPTNQQFPVMPDSAIEKLSRKYAFANFGRVDATHTCVRFCTSWWTPEENVDALIADLKKL
ncbi:MAG: beta-eliminating lyase-related protein [Clostridia bacterium]|nr:beta-eliminating lyase-related protein [Clostridia bacterium]